MISSTATYTSPASTQVSTYSYDGDGRRAKRIINGTETWQVYGIAGELLAEYPVNGTASVPQKEYGYRNGQLLITATAAQPQQSTQNVTWTNAVGVSVSGNSFTKTASWGWANAGAVSAQALSSGDGYVEFTVGNSGDDVLCGLSHGDTDQ